MTANPNPELPYDWSRLPKLNPTVKKRWLDALRSGEYHQGAGRLRTAPSSLGGGDRFCCLGVLCDVVKDDLGLSWEAITSHPSTIYWMAEGVAYPPDDVWRYVTDTVDVEQLPLPDGAGEPLAAANDSGWTFDRLAAVIEKWM